MGAGAVPAVGVGLVAFGGRDRSDGQGTLVRAGGEPGRGWRSRRCAGGRERRREFDWFARNERWARRRDGGLSERETTATMEAVSEGRPRCVQRGLIEIRSASSPSQRRGAQVREQVWSRTGRGFRRHLHYPGLGARKTPCMFLGPWIGQGQCSWAGTDR